MSSSLFETLGADTRFEVRQGILRAFLSNGNAAFPIPEASAQILAELSNVSPTYFDPYLVDQVMTQLELSGFRSAVAMAFAPVLLEIARVSGVSVFEYFNFNDNTVKLVSDTVDAINAYRPAGSQLGISAPNRNQESKLRSFVRP
jgi:hypothetical protein